MKPFNKLTPAQAERLALLLEELGEAQQAVGKILRHGYASHNPDRPMDGNNTDSLERELGDVECAIGLLEEAGDISPTLVAARLLEKRRKVGRYLHHQDKEGA